MPAPRISQSPDRKARSSAKGIRLDGLYSVGGKNGSMKESHIVAGIWDIRCGFSLRLDFLLARFLLSVAHVACVTIRLAISADVSLLQPSL